MLLVAIGIYTSGLLLVLQTLYYNLKKYAKKKTYYYV